MTDACGRRRRRLPGAGLLAVALALFAASLLLAERRLDLLAAAVTQTDAEGNWGVMQARFELERLRQALELAAQRSPTELRTRFDVFWSRVETLRVGAGGARIRALPGAAQLLGELRAELGRHVAAFDAGPDPAAVAALRAALPPFADRLQALALDRLNGVAASHAALQQGARALRSASLLSLAGLLTSAAILIFLLYREIGLTRELLRRAEEDRREIEHLAHHDPLTGLPNRRLFEDRLAQALAGVERSGRRVALLLLDLDGFKDVNDTHGHRAGDELLRAASARLAPLLRSGDTLARLGGDEFAALQVGPQAPADAMALAERMVAALAVPFPVAGGQRLVVVGASVGIALYPDDGAGPDELRANADTALYGAKAAGRGCAAFYRPEFTEEARGRRELRRELAAGIEAGELELHYQPKVAARDGRLTGLEALLRWRHPRHGTLGPDRFLPIAEESGLIDRLGAWVLADACGQLGRWRADGLLPPRLAVNLSPSQLRQGGVARQVEALVRGLGITPADLELELTEHVLLDDDPRVRSELLDLDRLGVRIALDDFGTGYSSLSYLHRLPLRTLKIDRSLVRGFGDGRAETICTHVIHLAHDLGMLVVAEGIETARHLETARELGFDELQGYWFARPAPAGDVARHLPAAMAALRAG